MEKIYLIFNEIGTDAATCMQFLDDNDVNYHHDNPYNHYITIDVDENTPITSLIKIRYSEYIVKRNMFDIRMAADRTVFDNDVALMYPKIIKSIWNL
jgi:hypothetical protein